MGATSPEELAQRFAEAIRGGDAEAAASLFGAEAVLTTQQGRVCEGIEAIRETLAQYAAMKPPLKIENLKTLRAGDLALMYNAPRHEGLEIEGRAVEVARRQSDGTWRYVMVFHPTG
ncbi:MAG TPA: DUF4440 domain-containing protein [Vicinamibacteria bacterium]